MKITTLLNFFKKFASNYNCLKKGLFLVFFMYSLFPFFETTSSVSFAQSVNTITDYNKRVFVKPEKLKKVTLSEAEYKRIYVTENMAPLPFKDFPYKPIYKGDISEEIVEESQKIKASIIKQEASFFDIIEQKEKDRKKNEKVMLSYNKEKNKRFNDYLQRLKKVKSQPANLKGLRYDFTDHLKNFQMISKR